LQQLYTTKSRNGYAAWPIQLHTANNLANYWLSNVAGMIPGCVDIELLQNKYPIVTTCHVFPLIFHVDNKIINIVVQQNE
jgi:hypothetical protein